MAMKVPHRPRRTTRPALLCLAGVALALSAVRQVSARAAFSLRMSSGATNFANMALRQAPSATQFYTNKMCPYAQKVWIALEVGGCPYEMTEVSLYGAGGKPDWFLDLNPDGQVPVLTCFGGAKIFIDSEYILSRIADGVVEVGSKLSMDSDDDREKMEEWRHAIANRVNPIGKAAVQRGGKNVKELMSLLKELDGKVKGPYLCGETVTVADCAAFPFLWRINDEFGPLTDEEGCGNIRKWLDTCAENPSFSKTVQGAWWWWW